MKQLVALLAMALLGACSTTSDPAPTATVPAVPAVRILLAGDVMTGRGLSDLFAADGQEVFAGIRHLIKDADLAGFNLESPLTTRPHTSDNENRLQANPATAAVLAEAGFDIVSLPNNHSTDSGRAGVLNSIGAVEDEGMAPVGAGVDGAAAYAPQIVDIGAITIGFLAYDATGIGLAATEEEAGVAAWSENEATEAVAGLKGEVDVVVVSVHGGAEYLKANDPGMTEIGATLAAAGADVVWGHGAHVIQPVFTVTGDRPTLVATSLGNLLFDQAGPDRTTGYILEVMVDTAGVVAYRIGVVAHPDRLVEFVEWLHPEGDSAWMHDSWWTLTRAAVAEPTTATTIANFRHGDLVAGAGGDIDGDGKVDLVASFRRPHRMTPFMETRPEVQWADADGRSAHLGVYEPTSLEELWVAGSVLMPIAAVEVCDGALAVVHDRLDDPAHVAAGAWTWNGFGFDTAPDIPGAGVAACADIDGDGSTEPVILDR